MLGFPPAIWYGGDSVSYMNSGLHLWPGNSRESGYGVFLEFCTRSTASPSSRPSST